MKLPEHLAASVLLAQVHVQPQYGWTGTLLMLLAGILPDLDGMTLLGGWRTYRRHHRVVGHSILPTVACPAGIAWLATSGLDCQALLTLWAWLQASLLLHLFTDVTFYRWPVQLLWPFSRHGWGLGLIGWNDLVPTLSLYAASATALFWPAQARTAAVAGLAALFLYVAWRAWRPPGREGVSAWLAGGWAEHHPRYWRWLTGDFVT
jgi:membrane-bound metal-dependent hydrolase YbcI (DUF457 family)